MGLIQNSDNIRYVRIFKGDFEVSAKPGDAGAVTRDNKNGKEIHVHQYKGVEGIITNIRLKQNDVNGKKFRTMEVELQDVDEKFCLSMPYNSGQTTAFYNMIEGVELDMPVRFTARWDKEKDRTSLFMSQEGVNIKWKYSKESPHASLKPQWEKKVIKNEDVWDNTEEYKFFERIMVDQILPKIRKNSEKVALQGKTYFPAAQVPDEDIPGGFPGVEDEPVLQEEIDQLPF